MKFFKVLSVFCFTVFLTLSTVVANEPAAGESSDSSLKKLEEGNKRYSDSKSTHSNQTKERREEVAKGQHPFAIIVSCSDSRVTPEIVFDQGLGDLFVVRVAGNIVDDNALGSIEYAVEHLGARLIVVLGHERCGAVDATLKGGEAPGHIKSLVDAIKPAVDKVKDQEGDKLDIAVKSNISAVVEKIKTSEPILKEFVHGKNLKVVGARYDLDEGTVAFIQ